LTISNAEAKPAKQNPNFASSVKLPYDLFDEVLTLDRFGSDGHEKSYAVCSY
jgi:hypothetical protein